ncbi:hypothetical protein ASD65_11635 [Microbacterium sp. Root61]|nr:hypothetical protein ASD65_11635 [Microbacterium sp. Root61]
MRTTRGGSDFHHGAACGRTCKVSDNTTFVTRGWKRGRDFSFSIGGVAGFGTTNLTTTSTNKLRTM